MQARDGQQVHETGAGKAPARALLDPAPVAQHQRLQHRPRLLRGDVGDELPAHVLLRRGDDMF